MLNENSFDENFINMIRSTLDRDADIVKLSNIIKSCFGEKAVCRRTVFLVLMKAYDVSIEDVKVIGAWNGFNGGSSSDNETNEHLFLLTKKYYFNK